MANFWTGAVGTQVSSPQPVTNSSAALPSGVTTTPVGNTYRGFGSDLFNAGGKSKEDWMRAEQSANNAYWRDYDLMQRANSFNRDEAQKQRDFEERMSSTAYQRAMEDMKKAGINPVLAYQQGGSSTPSGSSASSSSGGRSSGGHSAGSNTRDGSAELLSGLLHLAAMYVGGMVSRGTQTAIASENNTTKFNIAKINRYRRK